MPDPVNSVPGIRPQPVELDPSQLRTARPSRVAESTSFKQILTETIGEVQRLQNEADMSIKSLVAGEVKDVTEAMIAVEKADIAFQTMMTVRNKMVAAYEEIMRMNV